MKKSPEGYEPYREVEFPPDYVYYLAQVSMAFGVIFATLVYNPRVISGVVSFSFGLVANLYLHESIHYITQSIWGYEPTFNWPRSVHVSDVGLSTKEAIIFLLSPQILTFIYSLLILLSKSSNVKYSLTIALVLNVFGGFGDFAWTIRRLTWPKGNLVLVDSDKVEFVSFPK